MSKYFVIIIYVIGLRSSVIVLFLCGFCINVIIPIYSLLLVMHYFLNILLMFQRTFVLYQSSKTDKS